MIGGQNTYTSREMSVKKYLTDNNPLNIIYKKMGIEVFNYFGFKR